MTDFKSLNLAAPLQSALDTLGYTTPTPIQMEAIPPALAGRDLMGIAQTGTGKTAAFSLPTLHHICRTDQEPPKRGTRVLVLAPTRELASQISVSFSDYGRDIAHLSVATVFGGVPIGRQIKRLVGGNDVLVATPGRLIDLLDRKAITLKDVEILILDEADQMMDMGFIHALRKIVPLVPRQRQTLFFSATMAPKIKTLASQFLTDPVKVSVSPANTTAEKVIQSAIMINQAEKQALLSLKLLDPEVDRALVFTRTKHGADRVVKRLAKVGIAAMAIHGNKSQGQRQRALSAFRDGTVKILIATDIAARGIDIEGITHVFNYEIPNVAEQYIHRIGRTARANREGHAMSFISPDEKAYLRDIEKLLGSALPRESLPDDFLGQVATLQSREAIKPPAQKGAPETRKGRGKSRKKTKRSGQQSDPTHTGPKGNSSKNPPPDNRGGKNNPEHKTKTERREDGAPTHHRKKQNRKNKAAASPQSDRTPTGVNPQTPERKMSGDNPGFKRKARRNKTKNSTSNQSRAQTSSPQPSIRPKGQSNQKQAQRSGSKSSRNKKPAPPKPSSKPGQGPTSKKRHKNKQRRKSSPQKFGPRKTGD